MSYPNWGWSDGALGLCDFQLNQGEAHREPSAVLPNIREHSPEVRMACNMSANSHHLPLNALS